MEWQAGEWNLGNIPPGYCGYPRKSGGFVIYSRRFVPSSATSIWIERSKRFIFQNTGNKGIFNGRRKGLSERKFFLQNFHLGTECDFFSGREGNLCERYAIRGICLWNELWTFTDQTALVWWRTPCEKWWSAYSYGSWRWWKPLPVKYSCTCRSRFWLYCIGAFPYSTERNKRCGCLQRSSWANWK